MVYNIIMGRRKEHRILDDVEEKRPVQNVILGEKH